MYTHTHAGTKTWKSYSAAYKAAVRYEQMTHRMVYDGTTSGSFRPQVMTVEALAEKNRVSAESFAKYTAVMASRSEFRQPMVDACVALGCQRGYWPAIKTALGWGPAFTPGGTGKACILTTDTHWELHEVDYDRAENGGYLPETIRSVRFVFSIPRVEGMGD